MTQLRNFMVTKFKKKLKNTNAMPEVQIDTELPWDQPPLLIPARPLRVPGLPGRNHDSLPRSSPLPWAHTRLLWSSHSLAWGLRMAHPTELWVRDNDFSSLSMSEGGIKAKVWLSSAPQHTAWGVNMLP